MTRRNASSEARDRLVERLAGSAPDHDAQRLRLGTGLASGMDPRLAALLPARPKLAAVLIGLTETAGEPGILLTVRSSAMRQHAGQVSFPGGAIEADDSGPAAAALREAREEVGLLTEQAQVVGFLPDQLVITGFQVTPVVAHIHPPFVPVLDSTEVEASFELPFRILMDPSNHRETVRRIGEIEMPVRDIHFQEHRIWGATAGMLLSLYELARQ